MAKEIKPVVNRAQEVLKLLEIAEKKAAEKVLAPPKLLEEEPIILGGKMADSPERNRTTKSNEGLENSTEHLNQFAGQAGLKIQSAKYLGCHSSMYPDENVCEVTSRDRAASMDQGVKVPAVKVKS